MVGGKEGEGKVNKGKKRQRGEKTGVEGGGYGREHGGKGRRKPEGGREKEPEKGKSKGKERRSGGRKKRRPTQQNIQDGTKINNEIGE